MDRTHGRSAAVVAAVLVTVTGAAHAGDTCLFASATCLAQGGNSYLYQRFSDVRVRLGKGDHLEYDIYLPRSNRVAKGGVDAEFAGGGPGLRDRKLVDQDGVNLHGDGVIAKAVGRWHHRRFPLDAVAGLEPAGWSLVFEADEQGTYSQFVDNVVVTRADGTRTVICENGPPRTSATHLRNGYSMVVLMKPVDRAALEGEGAVERLIAVETRKQKRLLAAADLVGSLDLAHEIASRREDADEFLAAIAQAREELDRLAGREDLSDEDFRAGIERVRAGLAGLRPLMGDFTGHLVGHAHIDSQWLWEWPEALDEFRKTFGQACKFMEEYPGFTFTQSSSSFYQATEFHHPELFEKIRGYVKEGRWELVGGQTCETDLNFISAEAHAMHFLYGQRFFRERFEGKQAVVAWSPDTFGHDAQMPQIAASGGCEFYYFCRAGRNIPLFWWEGMDGTRLLTFQEVGSWYNSDLKPHQFEEMMDFERRTGSKDMLWVYGVGNHGGGPTREYIEVARSWQRNPCLPTVKFSTATEFFRRAKAIARLDELPVVKGEMNTVFEGCYTTHGDVKRWNSDAQALAESAEALAAIAARYGYPYPGTALRRAWEDILWNHHHDTIDGSSVNAPYRKSKEVFGRALGSTRRIASEAADFIAARVDASPGELVVLNPSGVERDAVVEVEANALPRRACAFSGDGSSPVQTSDDGSRGVFLARALPPFGYRAYRLGAGRASAGELSISDDGQRLENANLRVEIDPATGRVASLFDKRAGRELVRRGGSMNRLEAHWERLDGMSAWNIGRVERVEEIAGAVRLRVVERGPVRVAVELEQRFRENTFRQRLSLTAGARALLCRLDVDWKEIGDSPVRPHVRMAWDVAVEGPTFTCGIPFGEVVREPNGREVPSLGWTDISDARGGVSLLADAKHGVSFDGRTLRLSVVRAPSNPDKTSDNYPQHVMLELFPHEGSAREAGTPRMSIAQLHPPLVATKRAGRGDLPRERSFVRAGRGLLVTAVKRAEDDDDMIVRLYESLGEAVREAEGLVEAPRPVRAARRANFIEDDIGPWGKPSRDGARGAVRAWEIVTLKLALDPAPGVTMTGTRGDGGKRAY